MMDKYGVLARNDLLDVVVLGRTADLRQGSE